MIEESKANEMLQDYIKAIDLYVKKCELLEKKVRLLEESEEDYKCRISTLEMYKSLYETISESYKNTCEKLMQEVKDLTSRKYCSQCGRKLGSD